MLTVSELYVYPVKSLGGFSVNTIAVTDRGFEHDRRWMLVDERNIFLTQRTLPAMALLQASIKQNTLHVQHKHSHQSISISLPAIAGQTVLAQIWDDVCEVQLADEQTNVWFSNMLAAKCRLAYMPSTTHRKVEQPYALHSDITNLSDAYPVLIIGQASLDDLNGRLTTPLPMNRFRPNIVFTGGAPYDEDSYNRFTINGVQFYGVKLCARCAIPATNQDTGIRLKEPSRTLAGYRKKNNNIYFGQNLLLQGAGTLAVGQSLQLIETSQRLCL